MWATGRAPVVLIAVGGFALVLGLVAVTCHKTLYDHVLDSQLQLGPDSKLHDSWIAPTVPTYQTFRFWNVTNWQDVASKRARPILQEVGPYTYRREQRRVNVTWNSNDTVTYMQNNTWFFEPDMSNGTVEDNITSLNLPLLLAAHTIEGMPPIVKKMIINLISKVGSQVFVTKTVRELLFDGYDDPLADAIAALRHQSAQSIGWKVGQNNSHFFDGIMNMDTGADISHKGDIRFLNYSDTSRSFTNSCGMLNGSAGSLFSGRLQPDFVQVYVSNLCRSLKLPYEKEVSTGGLDVNRYAATEMLFGSPEVNPDNWCNCHGQCPPSGLLDMSNCAPLNAFASLPHMLFVEPGIVNQTEGQHPGEDGHVLYLDIEPRTGTPVSSRLRLQNNLLLQANPDIAVLNNVPTAYMPILWIEAAVDIPPDMVDQLSTLTKTVPVALRAVSGTLTALGGVLLFSGIALRRHRL
ncbi:protein croquemort-like [Pollicipes pollicipes]|uniref:protein croquemort-like n=1 Tax=Pollicipes pollicipes TaxID=41117 RepID=UPI001884F664|nr:protein croquemort-like [Pollicipes pollicipes]